ncbi:MAG: hypothetical protein COA45_01505 [Zetaproteobacteria bacterium]|nr:MAG: hypothetical protein COA45_01505 [Zetaproteobacteria bacterium]
MKSLKNLINGAFNALRGDNTTYTGAHIKAGLMDLAKSYESHPNIQDAHHNAFKTLDIKTQLNKNDITDIVIKTLDYMQSQRILLPENNIRDSGRVEQTVNHIISAIENNSFEQNLMDSLRFDNLTARTARPSFEPIKLVIDNTNSPHNN